MSDLTWSMQVTHEVVVGRLWDQSGAQIFLEVSRHAEEKALASSSGDSYVLLVHIALA